MNNATIFFSVVIPAFNSGRFIEYCLNSIEYQSFEKESFEVLVVDDCSTDNTLDCINRFKECLPNMKVLTTKENGGPGMARNVGINTAKGEWIVFVDSDDELESTALGKLYSFIRASENINIDAVGYNWSLIDKADTNNKGKRDGRRDAVFLGNNTQTIQSYLEYRMDHSVIYTAVKKNLLQENRIYFEAGIHEDVDFIFKVYFFSRGISYLNEKIYRKRSHPDSITHCISRKHIDGYFRAWREIKKTILKYSDEISLLNERLKQFEYGSYGVIATRVREVVRQLTDTREMYDYFHLIYENIKRLEISSDLDNAIKTTYNKIVKDFLEIMNDNNMSNNEKSNSIAQSVKDLDGKSWSCIDLHHSVFLRGDQVRTCCKRFFVEGEMRGDVSLFDVENGGHVSSTRILGAKQELHQKLNSGVSCACDGCPFLEFREWGQMNNLEVRYLSLEYHSVCNLKCSYCSEEYYGGKTAVYDISQTLESLVASGSLDSCSLVVWGGGEPTIGKDFEKIVNLLKDKVPHAQQRVLTNAVKPSEIVKSILKKNMGQVVTSIDAGTDSTFEKIRGKNRLRNVCATLRDYASVNAGRVTIKYIFTEGNCSSDEVRNFVDTMVSEKLLDCNFQISGDFKQEHFSMDVARNMLLMYGLLRKKGCEVVYLDELVRHRIMELTNDGSNDLIEELHSEVGINFIATSTAYPSVLIWGAGQQAKYLINNSKFIKQTNLIGFVDSTPSKIGKEYLGYMVHNIEFLKENRLPFAIAAVQGYPLIVEQMALFEIEKSRLIKELII